MLGSLGAAAAERIRAARSGYSLGGGSERGRAGRGRAVPRYCAHCGSSLEATALRIGHCTICGTEIDAADVGLGPNDAAAADSPTQPTPSTYAAAGGVVGMPDPHTDGAHTTPALPQQWRQRGAGASSQRHAERGQQRAPSRWALLLLSAVVLLLVGAAIYALAQRGAFSIVLGSFASSNANANSSSNSSSGGATATARSAATGSAAPHSPTQTTRPGSTASPAPRGSPTPSPTATPIPPTLFVAPTIINITLCVAVNTTFTVANTGGAPLSWSASANVTGYTITPSSWTLDPGAQKQVTVTSLISLSGIVTVSTPPGVRNSPQHVTINCTA
jgi:hypothetical protein